MKTLMSCSPMANFSPLSKILKSPGQCCKLGPIRDIGSRKRKITRTSFKSDTRSSEWSLSFRSLGSPESKSSSSSERSLTPKEGHLKSQNSAEWEESLISDSTLSASPRSSNHAGSDSVELTNPCQCIATLDTHRQQVSALAIDGDLLYTASLCKDIRVWKLPYYSECTRFGSGNGVIKALLVAGSQVYSAHQDHKIRVWRRSIKPARVHHKLLATLPTVMDYLPKMISQKNYVEVRRHHKRPWIEHVDTISVLALGRNGVLYSGSWDKTIKVWRLSDLKCMETFEAHNDAINALIARKDGFLYSGSADSTVKVWARFPGRKRHAMVATLQADNKSAVNALATSSDERALYSGGSDGSITVWERKGSGRCMGSAGCLRGHRGAVLTLCRVGDEVLCSGSADKSIRVWRRGKGNEQLRCTRVLEGHRGPVKCIAGAFDVYNATRKACVFVYSGSLDRVVKVWWMNYDEEQDEREIPQAASA